MTLKHIILSLSVMAAGTVAVHAQRVNFTIGGGISSHTGSSTDNVGAFKLGASYEYEIPGNFSIEPGVFFYAKGYKDKNESVYMRDDKGNIVNDEDGNPLMGVKNVSTGKFYVEVPVMANYYLEVAPLHYIEFSAGPYAAVGVGGKRNTFKEKGTRRFDCGISAGVAYEFNRIFAVGVQTDFGFINFRKDGGKNISGILTFSYRLRLD